jgi:hypothetical protein
MTLTIAGDNFVGFCLKCGHILGLDGKCKIDHKIKGKRKKRFSGKSKSEHAFGKY